MDGHSRPPPSDPPDSSRCPGWMIGDDELQHTIALQMRVRTSAASTEENEFHLPTDPFVIGNAVMLAVGPANARKVTASKEARGTRYILRTNSKMISEQLQKITELPDKTPVEIVPHPTLNVVQGIVYDLDTINHTEEYMLSNLRAQGICSVRRIKKRKGEAYQNTPLSVLSFQGSVLPQHVYFGLLRIPVRMYYPSPMLCFRCANYGHTKKKCDNTKFTEVCLNCSTQHDHPVGENCQNTPFCKHCQEGHTPISKICRVYQEEQAIIKTKVDRGLSYGEARANFREANKATTYANVLQNRLRNDESEKDKVIKMLQQEVESLRQVILELKQKRANPSISDNNVPTQSSAPSTSKLVQPIKSLPGKTPSVALSRLNSIEQCLKTYTENQVRSSNSNPNLELEPTDSMDFESNRNNKRKGNKNKTEPESPERKKGIASSSKKK